MVYITGTIRNVQRKGEKMNPVASGTGFGCLNHISSLMLAVKR